MNRINYGRVLARKLDELSSRGEKPSLLLHACCAPCSSYVLEYLYEHFEITLLYYNPNIYPENEFGVRLQELERFVGEMAYQVPIIAPDYIPDEFYSAVRGLEQIEEGGERCYACYELRLRRCAGIARERRFDYFTTTLSIGPRKDSDKLIEIGRKLEAEYGVNYLYSDFKRNGGHTRSIVLSREHNLYRQDYCGCVFSKVEAEKRGLGHESK